MGTNHDGESESAVRAPVRVVVVDDSVGIRERVAAMLVAYGADVVSEVADGMAAIEETRRLRPDLVVLDIRMPGMGGLEALPRLKALDPSPIVAIITNHAHSAYASRCAALGADHFLDKAEDLAKLHQILDDLVEEAPAGGR